MHLDDHLGVVDLPLVRERRTRDHWRRTVLNTVCCSSGSSSINSADRLPEAVPPRDGAHAREVVVVPRMLKDVERDEARRGDLCGVGGGGGAWVWEARGWRRAQGGEAEARAEGEGDEVAEEAVPGRRS